MKVLALLGSSAVLVLSVAHQDATLIPEPLAGDFAKLSQAKTIKVHFQERLLGETAKSYTLELGKDNKFKLTGDAGFEISDGTTLTVYKKSDNTFTQTPLTKQLLTRFSRRNEVFGWEAFFQSKPGTDLATATPVANRNVIGHDYKVVEATVKSDNHAVSYLIDPASGLTYGFEIKKGDKQYLVIADQVQVGTDPAPESDFAFVAPDGATMVKAAEEGSVAGVLALMNDHCMPCHSANSKRAGVDCSSYEGLAAIVVPGQSSKSLLVEALKGDGFDLMPKGRAPLTDDQIATVSKWIDAGAKNQ